MKKERKSSIKTFPKFKTSVIFSILMFLKTAYSAYEASCCSSTQLFEEYIFFYYYKTNFYVKMWLESFGSSNNSEERYSKYLKYSEK